MTGSADPQALAAELGDALRARGLWLATAESCTGGGIAATCTRVPGASGWLQAGLVTYTLDAKQRLLGVPAALLERHGAVSEPVARAMAEGALAASGADLAVSVTGVAGPGGGAPLVPVGTVWFGWALRAGPGGDAARTETGVWRLDGDREAVRAAAVVRALQGALAVLGVADPPPADD
jgi:nicotinamide-nucleotide amidase